MLRNYLPPETLSWKVVAHLTYFPITWKRFEYFEGDCSTNACATMLLQNKKLIHPPSCASHLGLAVYKRKSSVVPIQKRDKGKAVLTLRLYGRTKDR